MGEQKQRAAGGALLDNGDPGAFDSQITYRPFVLKDGAVYRMWFNGSSKPFNCPTGTRADNRRIGYAESNDGVTWVKIPQPGPGGAALARGAAGAFDSGGLTTPSVSLGPTAWSMYYAGFDTGGQFLAGVARAPR